MCERERLTVHAALCRAGAGKGQQGEVGGRSHCRDGLEGREGAEGWGLPGLHLIFQEKSNQTPQQQRISPTDAQEAVAVGVQHPAPPASVCLGD